MAYDFGVQPQRTFWTSAWSILVIVCLLLMVLSVSGIAIFYYSSICSLGERNQLRGDIPLPCGTTFQDHLDRSKSGTTGKGSEEWVYTVDGTTPAQIKNFYMQQLPANGWTLPAAAQAVPSLQAGDGVLACKGGTVVVISGIAGPTQTAPATSPTPTATPIVDPDDGVPAPLGGSLLNIIIVPGKNLSQAALMALNDPDCSG